MFTCSQKLIFQQIGPAVGNRDNFMEKTKKTILFDFLEINPLKYLWLIFEGL